MEQCNTHNRQLSSIKTAVALLHLLSFGVAPTESSACGRSFPVALVWFDLHQVRGSFAPAAAAPATWCVWGPRRAPSPPAPPHSQASPLRAPPGRAICGAASGRAPSNAGGGGGRSWGLPMRPAFEKAGPPPTPARGRGGRTKERRRPAPLAGAPPSTALPQRQAATTPPRALPARRGCLQRGRVPAGAAPACSGVAPAQLRSVRVEYMYPLRGVRALDRSRRPLWPRSRAYGAQTIRYTTHALKTAYSGRPAPSRGIGGAAAASPR